MKRARPFGLVGALGVFHYRRSATLTAYEAGDMARRAATAREDRHLRELMRASMEFNLKSAVRGPTRDVVRCGDVSAIKAHEGAS